MGAHRLRSRLRRRATRSADAARRQGWECRDNSEGAIVELEPHPIGVAAGNHLHQLVIEREARTGLAAGSVLT
jgi:hypothetical protein